MRSCPSSSRLKLSGDTNVFTKALKERADEFREIAGRSQESGALHHQFAVGEGFVLVSDEWESAGAFDKFFSDPQLMAFIGSVGGDPNVAPEISVGGMNRLSRQILTRNPTTSRDVARPEVGENAQPYLDRFATPWPLRTVPNQ